MAKEVTMPQLGESVTEGTLEKWLVKEGDYIDEFEPLCEVVTDKVNAEVPSTCSGVISKILVEEGETVEVGRLICYITEVNAGEEENHGGTSAPAVESKVLAEEREQKEYDSLRHSPVVRRLAREHNIDLHTMTGTGKGGRITRRDVLNYIENKKEALDETALSSRDQVEHDLEIPLSAVRRTIAQKMVQSKTEIPHAWTMVEVDVTELVNYRDSVKESFYTEKGVRLTYLPFFIKAAAEALREFPMVNSQWLGDKIVQKKGINISISVATEEALFVPVIKHADQKNITQLAREINELAHRTREGKLTPEDIEGGTFTVNNIGSFGTILSQPIINYPQAAIISVEAISPRVAVIDGMIAVRQMVNLCLSLDHRILDGLVCGRFLKSIKERLEAMGESMRVD